MMGLADHNNGFDIPAGAPAHRVRLLRPYLLGQHEVTQAEYSEVMGKNPSHHTEQVDSSAETRSFPVENVSWYEATEFCERLSALPAERKAARHYRLPTEAEWEYACRGGSKEPYHWARHRRPDDETGDAAGILPAIPLRKVSHYAPNAFGLFDMRGNVWEWNADWFDSEYYSRSPIDDPQGPRHGYIKVVRGSDWTFVGEGCKINYQVMPPFKRSAFVGFRVVCEFLDSPAADSNLAADE